MLPNSGASTPATRIPGTRLAGLASGTRSVRTKRFTVMVESSRQPKKSSFDRGVQCERSLAGARLMVEATWGPVERKWYRAVSVGRIMMRRMCWRGAVELRNRRCGAAHSHLSCLSPSFQPALFQLTSSAVCHIVELVATVSPEMPPRAVARRCGRGMMARRVIYGDCLDGLFDCCRWP